MYVAHTENTYTEEAVDHVEWKFITINRHLNPSLSPLMIHMEKERNKIYRLMKECDLLSFLQT